MKIQNAEQIDWGTINASISRSDKIISFSPGTCSFQFQVKCFKFFVYAELCQLDIAKAVICAIIPLILAYEKNHKRPHKHPTLFWFGQ